MYPGDPPAVFRWVQAGSWALGAAPAPACLGAHASLDADQFWRLLKVGLELRVMRRQLSNFNPLCPDSIFYELQETLLGCQCSTQQAFGHQTTAVVLDRSAVRSSELGALRDDDWMKS